MGDVVAGASVEVMRRFSRSKAQAVVSETSKLRISFNSLMSSGLISFYFSYVLRCAEILFTLQGTKLFCLVST